MDNSHMLGCVMSLILSQLSRQLEAAIKAFLIESIRCFV